MEGDPALQRGQVPPDLSLRSSCLLSADELPGNRLRRPIVAIPFTKSVLFWNIEICLRLVTKLTLLHLLEFKLNNLKLTLLLPLLPDVSLPLPMELRGL